MIFLNNIIGVQFEELKKKFVNVCKWLNFSFLIFGDPSSPDTKFLTYEKTFLNIHIKNLN
jgi:hypothetical protein